MSLLDKQQQKDAKEYKDDFEVLPAGVYLCRVMEVEKTTSRAGAGMLKWTFKVAKGQPAAGRRFWRNTMLQGDGWPFTVRMFKDLGLPLDADAATIEGTPCCVFVEVGTRQDTGEPQNNVKQAVKYDGTELPEEDAVGSDSDIDAAFGESDGLI